MGLFEDYYATGPALRRFRRGNGLSQNAVADVLGVHQSMISKWESGRERPSFSNQRAIWRFIGEEPQTDRVEALWGAVSAMPLSAGLFDTSGKVVAESARRRAWTGGVPLQDLMTEQDRANVAELGGVETVLSCAELCYTYYRRRVHTGEHTLLSSQNLRIGRTVFHLVTISPLPSTAVLPCGACAGYGQTGRGRAAACPECAGFGYRPADRPSGPLVVTARR